MHKFGERCDLIQEGGRITDPTIDKRMDFHFNALLDVVSEWRKDKTQLQDVPLGGMGRLVFWLFHLSLNSNLSLISSSIIHPQAWVDPMIIGPFRLAIPQRGAKLL